jgi:hypothetical protein
METSDARKLILVLLSGRQGGQGDARRYQKMLEGNASQAYLSHGPSLPEACLAFANL